MGRHSSTDQGAFYRSAAIWLLPWTIVTVIALAAVWIAVDALGGDVRPASSNEPGKQPVAGASDDPSAEATDDSSEGSPSPDPVPKKEREKGGGELIIQGVSVQVLNGTDDVDADDRLAGELESLGFEIAAVNRYVKSKKTVVYWSSGASQAAAEAIGDRFDWEVEPKPEELSSEVSVHILIGADQL